MGIVVVIAYVTPYFLPLLLPLVLLYWFTQKRFIRTAREVSFTNFGCFCLLRV
jgi:hypothetical protein